MLIALQNNVNGRIWEYIKFYMLDGTCIDVPQSYFGS